MKNRFHLLAPIVFIGLTYWACGSGSDSSTIDADFPARMEALLKEAVKDPRNIDAEKAATYLAEAERYADVRAGDTSAVFYLFKAAEVATVQRQYAKAVELYGRIANEFSSHPRAPQALFMQAFTYDENLGQIDMAREKYQEFIANYPQHDFADDAQIMLDNLGKSDEEILRALEASQPAATEE
jgi:tetratricopeptide (TPR) repeat protein